MNDCVPLRGHQSGQPQSQQHLVVVGDVKRSIQLVNPRREYNVQAVGQLLVDGRGGVSGTVGHIHVLERHTHARGPIEPGSAPLDGRDVQEKPPVGADSDVGLLGDHRRALLHNRGLALHTTMRAGRPFHPDEHHVPHRPRPAAHLAIPGHPLLLRPGEDRPVHPGVGHEPARGKARRVTEGVLKQQQAGLDMHTAQRGGL
mmetsp:Transcript_8333/g.12632  ORF Transcript_8333/g.12632 Transcript_8333/m.12632 type:complete len:201 (-) Transcript_8333:473-1075(-)